MTTKMTTAERTAWEARKAAHEASKSAAPKGLESRAMDALSPRAKARLQGR